MNRWWSHALVMALALVAGSAITAEEKPKTRNPFNVKDVPDPDGEDVKAFAAKVKLAGDGKDANAEQWAEKATAGKKDSVDGECPAAGTADRPATSGSPGRPPSRRSAIGATSCTRAGRAAT